MVAYIHYDNISNCRNVGVKIGSTSFNCEANDMICVKEGDEIFARSKYDSNSGCKINIQTLERNCRFDSNGKHMKVLKNEN